MNNNLVFLIKGELQRLHKYRITLVSFLIALVWFLLLYFIDDIGLLSTMLPMIIFIDATMMSVIFIGSILFFEKSEQTISTLLVTPTSVNVQILSKVIGNTIQMFISTLLIVLVFYVVKQVEVNWLYLVISLIISIMFHSLLGFIFSFHSKDFTSMLLGVMMYTFILTIPTLLHQLDIFFKGEIWGYILLITPANAAYELINAAFSSEITLSTILALISLTTLGILGYIYYIRPKYKYYSLKHGGL